MHWARTGRAARVVAVVFLLWTGLDLINPSLCAIDREPDSRSARAESVALTTAAPIQTPPNGAEDCFCCCHHVVTTTVCVPIPQVDLAQRLALPPIEQVRVFRARLDHPPQFV